MDQIKEKLKKLLNINLTSVSKKLSGRKETAENVYKNHCKLTQWSFILL